ncbi:MAG TPA: protein kinase [Sedimentisphaerales bacterium]|nr:protein kinase [Sedimentisphaerales bacterium]
MTGCLSPQDMAVFLEGSASPEQLTFWRRHLRSCDSCAVMVARLRAGVESPPLDHSRRDPDAGEHQDRDRDHDIHPHPFAIGLEPNLQLGDFRIERRLGCGAMGVVYQALQVSLNRRVALKVLPSGLIGNSAAIERFHREARAAAKLRHPNIVTIHSEGIEQGVCYFAMEMIDGQSLEDVIDDLRGVRAGAAPRDEGVAPVRATPCVLRDCRSPREYFDTVARLIAEVADALAYAHREGIIHRDVKPSNLILASSGRLVLLDFGIARVCEEQGMTVTGSFVGTPRYMSPEQVRSDAHAPDQRSDVYALGATLYELLTLRPLFDGTSREQVIGQILSAEPARPRLIDRRIPVDLETICCKAIEKEPQRRYDTAADLAADLRRHLNGQVIHAKPPGTTDRLVKLVRRRKIAAVMALGLLVATAFALAIAWKHYSTRWAQQDAMAQIDRLIQEKAYFSAFLIAERAARYIPDDPLLANRWPLLSREHSISTQPAGAKVYIRDQFADHGNWKYIGTTPLKHARIPFGTNRWKVEKSRFVPIETVLSNDLPAPPVEPEELEPAYVSFILQEMRRYPANMVWIPSCDLDQRLLFHGDKKIPSAPAFLIDKYEVTNRQFREFVDRGGYENPELWEHEFIRDGQVIPWSQGVEQFRDQTGQPGPATWRNGTYSAREADFPVRGVSWYEAAAYARFRDKHLPTIFHWVLAAHADDNPSRITRLSNFSDIVAPVGRYKGMGRFGLCDAAGNVREWCSNAVAGNEELRCNLGGAVGEYDYLFVNGTTRSAWDRDEANGFRCVKYLGGKEAVPPEAFAPVERKCRDLYRFTPVSDEVFRSYIETSYDYDQTELHAAVEAVDEEPQGCRRERVTFDAAYPNERVIAYLHLPETGKPPYQVVVWYPGEGARTSPWDQTAYTHELVCLIQSGRAVVVPFYKGTYERRLEKHLYPPESIQSRNLYVQRSQDLRRTIDYLETRRDIDTSKIAYVGLGWGAQMGPVMIATESRFKAGILLHGGICGCKRHPASDPANFAPRVTIPMLMINTRDDSIVPYETAQRPLFGLLGSPATEKRHILFPGGHAVPREYRKQYHREIVEWLDRCLGPVR